MSKQKQPALEEWNKNPLDISFFWFAEKKLHNL